MGKRSTQKIRVIGWVMFVVSMGCFPLNILFLLHKEHDADWCL